jgi:hypothetical protein
MKHLSLELEKLEERIAPGVCTPCGNHSKDSHNSKDSHKSKESHKSKDSHHSKEHHSKDKCGHK